MPSLSAARMMATTALLCSCADVTAAFAAELTGLNRNTVNRYYMMLRARIAELCERDSPFNGEVDESSVGPRRVRGRHDHGAGRKTIVFGLLKRGGKVYTQIVPDISRRTLMQGIEKKADKSSTMYTDGFNSSDGLIDWGHRHHYRVHHGADELVETRTPRTHINGIESFWGYATNRLVNTRGLPRRASTSTSRSASSGPTRASRTCTGSR